MHHSMRDATDVIRTDFLEFQYCDRCDNIKPPRTHHCSVCNRCVMRMDHHCPWVGNCVGVRNHKFFILFLFYASVACVQIAASVSLGRRKLVEGPNFQPIVVIMASVLSVCLGFMCLFHLYLVSNNFTTLEMGILARTGHYKDLGCLRAIKLTFGANPFLWPLPVCGASEMQILLGGAE